MAITQLDCFKATVAHEPHEGLLFKASFTPECERKLRQYLSLNAETDLKNYFNIFTPRGVSLQAPDALDKADCSEYFKDVDIPESAFINGLGVLEIPGSLYHFTQYISPLRNATKFDEIESFPYPSLEGYSDEGMAEKVEDAHANQKVATLSIGHMYENAWQIRGYTQFLMDMVERPEWCEYILDRMTECNIIKARAAAIAGVDLLHSGDDVANQRALMFSPPQWRRFIKSRWEKVYSEARRIKPDIQIWYHSDGDISEIIPELIEIGVTILNPVQPECLDPFEIKKLYGDRLVIDGAIGTQTTMPFGTPDDVRRTVRDYATGLGSDGAYIASPTHTLEPEVAPENILAFVETAKEFGEVV